jgi:hypothetical protein
VTDRLLMPPIRGWHAAETPAGVIVWGFYGCLADAQRAAADLNGPLQNVAIDQRDQGRARDGRHMTIWTIAGGVILGGLGLATIFILLDLVLGD